MSTRVRTLHFSFRRHPAPKSIRTLLPRLGNLLSSSTLWTNLLELLQAGGVVNRLVVCGMMTHRCIDTTVRAAKDYGIPFTLLYGACAARELKIMGHSVPAQAAHDAYMAGLNGMFAEVKLADQLEL